MLDSSTSPMHSSALTVARKSFNLFQPWLGRKPIALMQSYKLDNLPEVVIAFLAPVSIPNESPHPNYTTQKGGLQPMPERLLHPADVAEILGVTKRRASELMRTMRCVNVSRNPACMNPRWAVTASEIDRWQKARTAIPDQRVDTPPARPGRRARHRHGWRLTWSCSSRTDGLSAAGRPNNASPAARPTGEGGQAI